MSAANPEDEFFLLQYSDHPTLTAAFTTDRQKIQDDLRFTFSKGRSALWDAIYDALGETRKAHNPHKALLIVSDGGENSSRYTENEINNLLRESDVPIYTVEILNGPLSGSRTLEELYSLARLTEIAEHSGGRHFGVESLNQIPAVIARINAELRTTAH